MMRKTYESQRTRPYGQWRNVAAHVTIFMPLFDARANAV